MKRIIIAALVVLALGITGCSVGTGSGDLVDDAVAEMPEGDVSNPFAVEPTDETEEDVADDVVAQGDDVVVEGDGDAVQTESEGIFEMQTEADDVLTDAVAGTYYEQTFRMVDKNRIYTWSVGGLPAGSGLSLEEDADSWRYKLHGTLVAADVGTHSIIISVVDSDSNSTSISFELTVESNIPVVGINENYVDPCTKPLRIIVEEFGGHEDNEVLNDGTFRAKVGSDANIKLRAVRGYSSRKAIDGSENAGGDVVPPVGEVKWTWKSKVKDSYHCHRVPKDSGHDHGWGSGYNVPQSIKYQYAWAPPIENACMAFPDLSDFGQFKVEGKYTQNATWRTRTRDAGSDVLEIDGQILYDGPLPVRDLPVDEDAVELIDVTVTDGCAASNVRQEAHKTIEIGIQYPVAGSQAEGGRLSDVEVDMDYGVVRHYWKGSSYGSAEACGSDDEGGYDGYHDVCGMNSKLVMVFTNEEGLSQTALNNLENSWTPHKAIEKSLGYIAYDFAACNEDDDNCDDRKVTIVDNQSDDLNAVQRIYLLWMSPSYLVDDGNTVRQLDFDIEDIEFETKYWSADYEDDDNVFGYNLISKHGAVRSDTLTNLDGMSPANSDGGVFRRRELAGYILNHLPPKQ